MPLPFRPLDRACRHLHVGMPVNLAGFGVTMTLVGATLPRLTRELGWCPTVIGMKSKARVDGRARIRHEAAGPGGRLIVSSGSKICNRTRPEVVDAWMDFPRSLP